MAQNRIEPADRTLRPSELWLERLAWNAAAGAALAVLILLLLGSLAWLDHLAPRSDVRAPEVSTGPATDAASEAAPAAPMERDAIRRTSGWPAG